MNGVTFIENFIDNPTELFDSLKTMLNGMKECPLGKLLVMEKHIIIRK
jgi:hypothetical protein